MAFVKEISASGLPVEEKFKSLVIATTGEGSPYMRAKDTMLEYFGAGGLGAALSDREKADMLVKLVGDMSASMTSKLVDAAIVVAKEERDAPYELAKLIADVEARQADTRIAESTLKLKKKELELLEQNKRKTELEMEVVRATAYSRTGIETGTGNFKFDITNKYATDYNNGLSAYTSRYTSLAASYKKDGAFSDAAVPTSSTPIPTMTTTGYVGLTEWQTRVQKRQLAGFDDNILQHAINSAGSTIAVMLSSESGSALAPLQLDAQYKAMLTVAETRANYTDKIPDPL